jgi:peroxiredoxin Q/BCP
MKLFHVPLALSLLGLLGVVGFASAQTPPVELKVGDMAPNFSLPGSDGKTYSLSDFKGRTVVLAWFVRAFTGG